MNQPWTTLLPVLLIGLGVRVALSLRGTFLRGWRAGRRRSSRLVARVAGTHTTMTWRASRAALAASVVLPPLLAAATYGQGAPGQPAPDQRPAIQPRATKSALSLQLNLDYSTAYFYHGIIQEDTGLILQPAAKLTINLYEQDDLKVDALLGTWNSFHGQKTGAQTHGDFTGYWYESDLIGGVVFTKGKWSLTSTCTFLTSPSDAYETVQELDFTVAYDDSEPLGKFAFHPYGVFGVEIGADASDGADSNTGTYLELGIAPGFSFDVGKTPVAVGFPASVGLSIHDYYQDAAGEDDAFGFAQVGVKASLPLPFGDRYGKWTLNAGVLAMYLGDHTAQYNGGDHEQLIGTVGLQLNF